MKAHAIIAAAGLGTRMEQDIPKPLLVIAGKPLIVHTLEAFQQCAVIDAVVLVVHPDFLLKYQHIIDQFGLTKVKNIINGGRTRSESIRNALTYVGDDISQIVVHDGARPLVSPDLIERAVKRCATDLAVVVAVPVKSTIKQVNLKNKTIERTLKRERLFEIQTPQVFDQKILLEAYQSATSLDATDDASLVEQMGFPVKIIEGDYRNIKVTTSEDVLVAEAFLKDRTT